MTPSPRLKKLTRLVHGVGEEGGQRAALARRLLLEAVHQRGKGRALHALSQHLHAVVVVADVLLIDTQHGQQHVEQVACGHTEQP